MLSARAIAVEGVGSSPLVLALLGFVSSGVSPVSGVPPFQGLYIGLSLGL